MQLPYSNDDLRRVNAFRGQTDHERIRELAHCICLLDQGLARGLGVLDQRKLLVDQILKKNGDSSLYKYVREHVSLVAYIKLDKLFVQYCYGADAYSVEEVAEYLIKRFIRFDELKSFYGMTRRLPAVCVEPGRLSSTKLSGYDLTVGED